jgi:hypothetical protein
VKHPEDLKAITVYSVGNGIGPIGHGPFARVFDLTFTTHGWKFGLLVYAGKDRIGEVVSSLGVFKSNVARFVFQVLRSFSSYSTRISAPASGAHRRYLIIGSEFTLICLLYRQFYLCSQCPLVLDVVAKNVHRQVAHTLAIHPG